MLRLLCLLSLVDGLRLFRVWYCVQGGCLVLFGAFACAVCGIVFSLYRFVGSSLLSRRAADSIAAPHRTLLPFLAPSLPPSLPLLVSIAPPPFSCLDHRSLLFLRCACWDEWIEIGTGRRRGQGVTVLTYLHGVKEAQVRPVLFWFD